MSKKQNKTIEKQNKQKTIEKQNKQKTIEKQNKTIFFNLIICHRTQTLE
jgi:hypothetical protein